MSVNKFKVVDVVKCFDAGVDNNPTIGKDYVLLDVSKGNATTPSKFKEGDIVYLIGFNHFKPCKLLTMGDDYLTTEFKVMVDDSNFETFTESGCYTTSDVEPSLVLATEENRQMLNKLLGVEYEPVKLTGSDLAKKLLKDKPQTCYMSDISDDVALSNKCIDLIAKFENGGFITMSGVRCKFAIPCNQHGEVLEDE